MKQGTIRTYVDHQGKPRRITLVEPSFAMVRWHRLLEPGTVSKWRLEDGSIIQIPDAAWYTTSVRHGSRMVSGYRKVLWQAVDWKDEL